MKSNKSSRFLICILLLLAMVFCMTACSTAQPEADLEPVIDEETKAAIELRTSIREIASGLEETVNTPVEDTSEFTVTLTMIESAEALIRNALKRVEGKLPEIQQEEVEAVLHQLYQAGILEEEAVYSLENLMFTYVYSGGILGGVHLQEHDDTRNTISTSVEVQAPTLSTETNSSGSNLKVAVFNGFEDTAYRRDYYQNLQSEWMNRGVDVALDTDVTVADLANLEPYDVIVLSMHGSTYQNAPIIAINEEVTTDTDLLYSKYLTEDYTVAKVMYLDGSSHYWILPDFFRNCYGTDGLANKIIYSESCCFYGCACYASVEDTTFGQALLDSSAEAVVGYYNSVGADYSRDMMKTTLESMFDGTTLDDALQTSIGIYGTDDGWEDPTEDKYPAHPCYMGDADTVLTASEKPEAPIAPEAEEEIIEEDIIPEEPAVPDGNTYTVYTTYIEGWPYVEDGSETVFFTQDSFHTTEDGQLMVDVGFRDYLYLYNEDAQYLQIGDTLQTAEYLGTDILVTEITSSGMDIVINGEYILYGSSLLDVWLLCDANSAPITYPSVWERLPVAEYAAILSYGLDIDPEDPASIFSENPEIASLLGYITIANEQITQIIFE